MDNKFEYDVFLGFSTKDEFVKKIWEQLTANSVKTFYAPESLPKTSLGISFDEEIRSALKQSKNFILVCTPDAMESEEIKNEYNFFYHKIHKEDKKQRRLIVLEGKGFTRSLLPDEVFRYQTAKSVDQIIRYIKGPARLITGPKIPIKIKPFLLLILLTVVIASAFLLFKPKKDSRDLLVTNLTFMDNQKKCPIENKEIAESINHAVINGMHMAKKTNANFVIDESGHKVSAMEKSTHEFAEIVFNQKLHFNNRRDIIVNKIMIPNNIDILVSGHYTSDNRRSTINLYPIVINRYHKKIVGDNLTFQESDFLCQSSSGDNRILCPGASKNISQMVQKLLDQSGYDKLHVSNITFIDLGTKSPLKNKELAELINGAVLRGMHKARAPCELLLNHDDHLIPDTYRNVKNLSRILLAPHLLNKEKTALIIDTLMNLYRVDVIVTGFTGVYKDTPSTHDIAKISIIPFIIIRYGGKIVSENLVFSKSEIFCRDPLSNKQTLCDNTYNQIAGSVQELLEEL